MDGTLDAWLLGHWYAGPAADDALFARSLPDTPQVLHWPSKSIA